LKKQIDAAEVAIAKASTCESQRNLSEAIRTLMSVRLSDHRELAALSGKIKTESSRLKQLVEQQTRQVDAGLARIRELIEASAFDDAVRLLQKLPIEFRTTESDELLAEASAKQRETVTLKAAIREAVGKKQLLDLAPKIQRLLQLQPNADGVQRLAAQVRDRLLVAAKKNLNAYEYTHASKLVARVPECAIDEQTQRLSEQIAELTWLANDLQLAPIVDEPLIEIAKRLAKRAPGDQRNVEQCSRLFRVAAEKPPATSKRFPAIAWAHTPRRPHVGCAIDWLAGSERLKLSSDAVAASEILRGRGIGAPRRRSGHCEHESAESRKARSAWPIVDR
jgi:hypothetical protein